MVNLKTRALLVIVTLMTTLAAAVPGCTSDPGHPTPRGDAGPDACADGAGCDASSCSAGEMLENGQCVAVDACAGGACSPSCVALKCEEQHQTCSATPAAHCNQACLAGYVWDSALGECRTVKRCADLSCSTTDLCMEATDTTDAACHSATCPAHQGLDIATKQCRTCSFVPNCSGAGETGTVLTRSSADNADCVCETLDNYYLASDSSAARPCDLDADGWVTDSAQPSIEGSDPVLKANAHCHVHRVSSVLLENEKGETQVAQDFTAQFGAGGLPLYESSLNDGSGTGQLPLYDAQATAGRPFSPSELNSMTKGCGSVTSDYNENGVADVDEWGGSLPRPQDGDPKSAAYKTLVQYYQAYTRFSYFFELHDGWYEQDAQGLGRLHVRERPRGPLDATAVPIIYPDNSGSPPVATGWQTCERHIDSLFKWSTSAGAPPMLDSPNTIGGDFAEFGDTPTSTPPWHGMTHHSQYKCVHLVDPTAYLSPDQQPATQRDFPELVFVKNSVLGRDVEPALPWKMNACSLGPVSSSRMTSGGVVADGSLFPVVACTVAQPATGTVGWAAVGFENASQTAPYLSYTNKGEYIRGCMNECEDSLNGGPFASQLWPHGLCRTCTIAASNSGQGHLVQKAAQAQPCDDAAPATAGFCSAAGQCVACGSQCMTGKQGICSPGHYQCDGKTSATCVGVAAAPRDCNSNADNDCSGIADRSETACECNGYQTAQSAACLTHPGYDGRGICHAGTQQCTSTGSGAQWSNCTGSVGPAGRTCTSASDNDCDGIADSQQWIYYRVDADNDGYCVGPNIAICTEGQPASTRLAYTCLGEDCTDSYANVSSVCSRSVDLGFQYSCSSTIVGNKCDWDEDYATCPTGYHITGCSSYVVSSSCGCSNSATADATGFTSTRVHVHIGLSGSNNMTVGATCNCQIDGT